MKAPKARPVARSEADLERLDQAAADVEGLSKSFSVTSITTNSRPIGEVAVKAPVGAFVIENQDQLDQLVESQFNLSVTVRNARTYRVLRLLIAPSLTSVWVKNTRASETEPDVSDIIDSIRSNGTNSIPVFGQFDPKRKVVTVFAGTRRRYATLAANVLLTMDLYFGDMSENDKHIIMHVENVRKDPDPFLRCRSIRQLIEPDEGLPTFSNQSQLAAFYGITRVHVNAQVMIGRLPTELVQKITDRQAITQERAHKFAQSFFKLAGEDSAQFNLFNERFKPLEAYRFAELDKAMKNSIAASNTITKPKKTVPPKFVNVSEVGGGVRVYDVSSDSGERKAIEVPNMPEEQFEALLELIQHTLNNVHTS